MLQKCFLLLKKKKKRIKIICAVTQDDAINIEDKNRISNFKLDLNQTNDYDKYQQISVLKNVTFDYI